MRSNTVDARPDERVDGVHMRRALMLSERARGRVSPNPLVGAVIVSGGRIVGEGWHEGPGTPHAEMKALEAAGERSRGGTLYVSLEPCTHQGRMPPCAPALMRAGIARVVAPIRDPNPVVDGRGFASLRRAGIQVQEGVLEEEAARLNAGYLKQIQTGVPFVTLKMAASLDGRSADSKGTSRWITGAAAREDVHRLRASADAIVVGAGTATADDPSLTVRLPGHRGRAPLRVVVDGRGQVPASGAVFDRSARTAVATTDGVAGEARAAWEAAGAEVWVFPDDGTSRVPLQSLMRRLGEARVQNVLIEGGPTLASSAVQRRVIDRLVIYLAPKLIGGDGAPGILEGEGVAGLSDALPVEIHSVEKLGDDLKVVADVHWDH